MTDLQASCAGSWDSQTPNLKESLLNLRMSFTIPMMAMRRSEWYVSSLSEYSSKRAIHESVSQRSRPALSPRSFNSTSLHFQEIPPCMKKTFLRDRYHSWYAQARFLRVPSAGPRSSFDWIATLKLPWAKPSPPTYGNRKTEGSGRSATKRPLVESADPDATITSVAFR